jgi:hypothetical protein
MCTAVGMFPPESLAESGHVTHVSMNDHVLSCSLRADHMDARRLVFSLQSRGSLAIHPYGGVWPVHGEDVIRCVVCRLAGSLAPKHVSSMMFQRICAAPNQQSSTSLPCCLTSCAAIRKARQSHWRIRCIAFLVALPVGGRGSALGKPNRGLYLSPAFPTCCSSRPRQAQLRQSGVFSRKCSYTLSS